MRPDRLLGFAATFAFVSLLAPAALTAQPPEAEGREGSAPQDVDLKDEEARSLFQAGRIAFRDGRFEDALRSFRRAYELSGRPGLLYNIGTTADRLRRDQEAIEAFEEYLQKAPDAPNVGEVERRLEVLRAQQPEPSAQEPTEPEASAPTPEQTAAAASAEPEHDQAPVGPEPAEPKDDGGSVASSWWLWTIVGVVVAGGVAAGVLLGTSGGDGGGQLPGTDVTVGALRGTR